MENRDEMREGLPPARPPQQPPAPIVDDEPGGPATFGQWLAANAFTLAVVGLVLAFLVYRFRWPELLAIGKAALGLSFVVFIHELGHFAVAKWCDVNVTTFSIGFGPAIPGCSYTWGETTYKLSLLPLGGYVQMVGQVDGDEGSDGSEDDPRSYRNKGVGQRMAIISAGVIMNVILAVVCFILVFQGPGKERGAGVVGQIDTGGPSFRHGVRTGAEIVQISDVKDPYFEDVLVTVMGSRDKEHLKVVTRRPGEAAVEKEIEPKLGPGDQRPFLGLLSPPRAELVRRRNAPLDYTRPTEPGTPADRAEPAFEFGDEIVGTTDPKDPAKVTELPPDPRAPTKEQRDYFELHRRLQLLAGKEVVVRVRRTRDEQPAQEVDIKVGPAFRQGIGARMQMGAITALRQGSPAEQAGVLAPDPGATPPREGDLIEQVEVQQPGGGFKVLADQKTLDPEKLPSQLKQWAQSLDEAAVTRPWTVRLTVRRHRQQAGNQFESRTLELTWDDGWRFDRLTPFTLASPLAIPELGLAYQVKSIVAGVNAKDSPLRPGDVIKNLRYSVAGPDGEDKTISWMPEDLEETEWAGVGEVLFQNARPIKSLRLKVERDKKVEEFDVSPSADTTWPITDRGWVLMRDTRRQKADGFVEAVGLGLKDTHNSVLQVFQNLRGMITGRVSVKQLGGPVMIASVAYRFAQYDFWEFVFFLGLISVNLAVVNFLPIPVLDGGHMVFLIYEKLRGKPASETVRVGATYAGLALILSLFLFVMYLDVSRLLL